MNDKVNSLIENGPQENQSVEDWARKIVLEHKKELEDSEANIEVPEESVENLVQIIVDSYHQNEE